MLDQNTDRLYWVIGAAIVVGALIGIAKVVMPDSFQTVMNFFTSQIPG